MKILLTIPGNLKTVPMNRFVHKTLEEMGHEVVPFDYGSRGILPRLLKKIDLDMLIKYSDKELMELVNRKKPDVFLTIFGFNHSPDVITKISRLGIPTICWWLNDPFQFERSAVNAPYYDFYFTNAKGSVDEYRERGVKKVFHLPVGIYPPVHRKIEKSEKKHDISFAGDWKMVREEVISQLIDEFRVDIFGPWEKKLSSSSPLRRHIRSGSFFSPEEMVEIFNQSKIVLNIHTWFGKTDFGINPRIFEANGCGVLQVSDRKEEISDFYEEGREIILYDSVEELRQQLRYFLEHHEERERIAANAHARTIQDHTYRHRMERMFSLCNLG